MTRSDRRGRASASPATAPTPSSACTTATTTGSKSAASDRRLDDYPQEKTMIRSATLFTVLAAYATTHAPLGAQDNFVPLFNGKDLTGWRILPGDKATWVVKNGILTSGGG